MFPLILQLSLSPGITGTSYHNSYKLKSFINYKMLVINAKKKINK